MEQLTLAGAAEWVARLDEDDATRRRREALLEALDKSRFAVLDERVGLVLRDFPETRDSDTELVLRYWQRFEADTLRVWSPNRSLDVLHDLEGVDSLTRARRSIQNDLHLFEPTEWTKSQRQENQRELLQHLWYKREGDPEIRFYLDETGSHGGELVGVGGLCVIDWTAFETHHAAYGGAPGARQGGWAGAGIRRRCPRRCRAVRPRSPGWARRRPLAGGARGALGVKLQRIQGSRRATSCPSGPASATAHSVRRASG